MLHMRQVANVKVSLNAGFLSDSIELVEYAMKNFVLKKKKK